MVLRTARRRHRVAAWPSAVLVLVMVVLAAVAGVGDTSAEVATSRFASPDGGFPPQPVRASGARPVAVEVDVAESAARRRAAAVAVDDERVAAARGSAWIDLGVQQVPQGAGHLVTTWSQTFARTVLATVVDGQVTAVEVVPPGAWQPPLAGVERLRAIDLARAQLLDLGVGRVGDLQGLAMHTMGPDGTPWPTRMAYVTFHAHLDARPEYAAWVDLVEERVVRWRRVGPPDRASQPRTGARGEDGGGLVHVPPQRGHIDWTHWSLDYDLSSRVDGIALADVTYRGVPVLARASMPAMTVFYDDDACGPFVDRLGPPELSPVYWADDAEIVVREFIQDGEQWLEVGILDTLGAYVLYQVFYLHPSGMLDAHTFAKGLQCEVDHVHYPFWRFDVDLAGPADDEIVRRLPDGQLEVQAREFDLPAAAAADHAWSVRDPVTGDAVHVAFDDGSWNVPGEVVPELAYAENMVYGRVVDGREAGEWRPFDTDVHVGHGNGESLDGADVSLWYRGFLPHATQEGPSLWHSTGVRLTLDLRPRYVRVSD